MRNLQKITVVLVSVVFCLGLSDIVQAENFVPTTCECQITCATSRTPPNPISPRSVVRRVGSGLTTQGFLDIINSGIDDACSGIKTISDAEARRLYEESGIPELGYQDYYNGTNVFNYITSANLGREINSEYVLGDGCAAAGELMSKTYSCIDDSYSSHSCYCLPSSSGNNCFTVNAAVSLSCERKNDRGLNQQEFAQSMAAINGTPERTQTTCNCSLNWTGDAASVCQNKQWSILYSDRRTRSSIFSEVNISTLCRSFTSAWVPAGLSDSTIIESRGTCEGTAENIQITDASTDGISSAAGNFSGSVTCSETTVDTRTPSAPVDYGPSYEPIEFSFPLDKINALNKVGISGSGTAQVQLLIGRIIKYLVGFLGTLALCIIIYSGLMFMISQGDADKRNESLKMMLWAGIGIVALLGAYSIVSFVFTIL